MCQAIEGVGEKASMRPGQSCPGVVSHLHHVDVGWRRFNEAGAIMPRSGLQSWGKSSTARRRFNEAGAIMPRSGSPGPPDGFQTSPASMRPGQSCPGSGTGTRGGIAGIRVLQ